MLLLISFCIFFLLTSGIPLSNPTDELTDNIIPVLEKQLKLDELLQKMMTTLNLSESIDYDGLNLNGANDFNSEDFFAPHKDQFIKLFEEMAETGKSLPIMRFDDKNPNGQTPPDFERSSNNYSRYLQTKYPQTVTKKTEVQKRNPEAEFLKRLRSMRRNNRMRYINNELRMAAMQHMLNL